MWRSNDGLQKDPNPDICVPTVDEFGRLSDSLNCTELDAPISLLGHRLAYRLKHVDRANCELYAHQFTDGEENYTPSRMIDPMLLTANALYCNLNADCIAARS